MSVSILLADDQPLLRRGFRMILEAEDDLTVVAEAGNGEEAVELAQRHAPDVALMDIRMPGTDGIEATQRITAAGPLPKVLVLTTFDLDEYAFGALRAGASGFLLKDVRPGELVAAIRTVAAAPPARGVRSGPPAGPGPAGTAVSAACHADRARARGAHRSGPGTVQY